MTYAEAEDAVEAVDNMDGSELLGRVLMVLWTRSYSAK